MTNPDVWIIHPDDKPKAEVEIAERQIPNRQADFAMRLIERWGAQLPALDPYHITARAIACAEDAFVEFDRRGWLVDLPSRAELEGADAPVVQPAPTSATDADGDVIPF